MQVAGRWHRVGDTAGEPEGSAEGVTRGERASPGGGVHARSLSGSEQQCGVLPCVGKRGEGSSQGGSTRSRARRAARKARGVGGAVQAARRAEPSMRAAQWVRGGALQRLVVLAVRGPGEPNAPGLADSARAFLSLAILIARGTRGTYSVPVSQPI